MRNRNRGIPGKAQTMEHATMCGADEDEEQSVPRDCRESTCSLQLATCSWRNLRYAIRLAKKPHTSRISHRPVVVALSATWTWGPGSSECLSRGALVAVIRPTEILAAQTETETAPEEQPLAWAPLNSFQWTNWMCTGQKVHLRWKERGRGTWTAPGLVLHPFISLDADDGNCNGQIWKFVGLAAFFLWDDDAAACPPQNWPLKPLH